MGKKHTDIMHNQSSRALLKRVVREHVAPYRLKIFMAIGCMMVIAATTATQAWLIKPAMYYIFIHKERDMLVVIPLAAFVVIFIGAMANYGSALCMRFVGQHLVADMQTRLFTHLMKSDIGLFHTQASGRLISRFTNDINLMRNAFTNVLTALTRSTLTTAFLVGLMIYQNPKLSLLSLIVFPVAIWPLIRMAKRMRKISDSTQTALGDFTVTLDEIFHGVRTVKSYNRENFEGVRARKNIDSLASLYLKGTRVQAAAAPMMEILSGVSIALVLWYGGLQVINNEIDASAFFSFIAAFFMAYKPVRSMSGAGSTLQEGLAAASRLFAVLDTKPIIVDRDNAVPLQVDKGRIVYDHATFHYGTEMTGVHDISLEVPAGKTAALVGLSGGGKSTLMNMLLRFYDVNSGSISIDGQDIRNVTLHSLRDAMAFVPQESMLFDDTIRANILYGREGAGEDELIAAAQNAAADEFIRELPQGYDTMIGAHGVRLSGGQRQRIAIARAMLKNAPILLLDEATSSLDNESERSIQQALKKLMQGRTTLVIAHRLSTIAGADVIYVVEGGRIIESGTHKTLMDAQGKYYRLYAENFDHETA